MTFRSLEDRQMRRKRHRVIYDEAGLVSKKEAEDAIAFAERFVEQIRELITQQPGLNPPR